MHAYLFVAKICVQETKNFVANCTIYQLIDDRKWIWVIWAHLVEIGVVYTHSPLAVNLGDHDYIGQLGSIVGFSYKIDR